MGQEELWTTLWKTVEDKPENAFRHALNRIVPQALAKTRAASPSARISGFSGVKHRTYSAKASASMHRHAQTRQQRVDNLWESPWSLWRKGALSVYPAVDKSAPGRLRSRSAGSGIAEAAVDEGIAPDFSTDSGNSQTRDPGVRSC